MTLETLEDAIEARDEALDNLEQARADYLAEAREWARYICELRGSATVNDVRELCAPPDGIDPRVMGAIFKTSDFVFIKYEPSARAHARPIGRFKLAAEPSRPQIVRSSPY